MNPEIMTNTHLIQTKIKGFPFLVNKPSRHDLQKKVEKFSYYLISLPTISFIFLMKASIFFSTLKKFAVFRKTGRSAGFCLRFLPISFFFF